MISIQQNLSELEKSDHLRKMALDCYVAAIANTAEYAVDLDAAITTTHRKHLSILAAGLVEAAADAMVESRSTLRGLLRDYRDRAAEYLGGLRNQLSSTAQALREMVDGLSQCDTDHQEKMGAALFRLRQIAGSSDGDAVRAAVEAAVFDIEQNLEQMRRQHKFTVAQMQTEIRLLHGRIDSLEAAAVTDEASQLSNRRFLAEYLRATSADGACFLVLKMRGLAEARVRLGPAIADQVVSTFGRRLRNTVPREAVIGRWSEQDFLAIVPAAAKPADGSLIQRFSGHLSMPYACMVEGKVVLVPIVVTAVCEGFAPGTPADQIQARITEAFQQ